MRTCGNCTFWERFSDAEGDLNFESADAIHQMSQFILKTQN